MNAKKKHVYFCPNCGPFIKVFKEVWTENSEGPYKIQFIQHIDKKAEIIDEIIIKSKPEGENIEYSFCGKCNRLIDKEESMNWTNQMIQMEINH